MWTYADSGPMCYWRLIIQTTACRSRTGPEGESLSAKAVLDVMMPTVRCVVPSRAQPGIEVDRRITKAVAVRAQRCLGVYCGVDSGGTVRVGDDVAVRTPNASRKVLIGAGRRTKRFALGLFTAAGERLSR